MGHVSLEARLLTAVCGMALFFWSLLKLRRRTALVPTCSLFLTVGLIFISFALAPHLFDRLSFTLGIKYPPVLYLIGCIFALILMIVHLASRLSSTDERCRRLAQELALLQASIAHRGPSSPEQIGADLALLEAALMQADRSISATPNSLPPLLPSSQTSRLPTPDS